MNELEKAFSILGPKSEADRAQGGLTDEEIEEAAVDYYRAMTDSIDDVIGFARAIERAILASQPVPTLGGEAQADDLAAVAAYTPGNWFDARTLDEMQAFYMSRLPAIREAAKEHGYAIGLHGSTRRDFDLMAMQWRDDASDKDTLAHAIADAACGITRDGAYQWERKPNGRLSVSMPICWTDHTNPDFDKPSVGHIDLSVIDCISGAVDGWNAAAAFIEKKAESYIRDHAETEHDTGAVVWHYSDAGRDYHSGLIELADELRAAAPSTAVLAVMEQAELEDPILMPRGLIGAACYLIRKHAPESTLLAKLRKFTFGRDEAPSPAAAPVAQEGEQTPNPLNGIPATMRHDEGAIARCSYCHRYSLDPATLSDRQPTCECGKQHGWCGSFKRPGPDSRWSGKAPADQQTSAQEGEQNALIASLRDQFAGFHLEIQLFPSGGRIEATGCAECGTPEEAYECASWKEGLGGTFEQALSALKGKLAKHMAPAHQSVQQTSAQVDEKGGGK